jgi:hypothetical protein
MLLDSFSKALSNVGSLFARPDRSKQEQLQADEDETPDFLNHPSTPSYDNDLCDSGLLSGRKRCTNNFSCWQTGRYNEAKREQLIELFVNQNELVAKSLDSRERKRSVEVDCYNALKSWQLKEQILGKYVLITQEHAVASESPNTQENATVPSDQLQQEEGRERNSRPFTGMQPEAAEALAGVQKSDWS